MTTAFCHGRCFTILVSLTLIIFIPGLTEAQSIFDSSLSGGMFQSTQTGYKGGRISNSLQAMVPGTSNSIRQQIFRELLSSQTPQLNWPAFPRIWLERARTEYISANTSTGLRVPIINTGAKVSIGFRYALKTTLVIMSSTRSNRALMASAGVLEKAVISAAANDRLQSEILRWDPVSHVAFPNVRGDYPMTGFCAFEASLATDRNKGFTAEVMGNGGVVEEGVLETMAHTLFSNFFQISPDISVSEYLEDVCNQVFREDIQEFVLNDFSKLVVERAIGSKSQCSPRLRGGSNSEVGDFSCKDWHRKNYSPTLQKITVPRCELQVDGAYRCVLRGKENTACPLYIQPESGDLVNRPVGRYPARATHGSFEYKCDGDSGLRCRVDRRPLMLFNIPIWPGRGVCVKK